MPVIFQRNDKYNAKTIREFDDVVDHIHAKDFLKSEEQKQQDEKQKKTEYGAEINSTYPSDRSGKNIRGNLVLMQISCIMKLIRNLLALIKSINY